MRVKASRQALKVALIYVIVAGCWILFSDEFLKIFIPDPDERIRFSIYKGWGFVLVTGGLLLLIMRRYLNGWERAEAALRESEERFRRLTHAAFEGICISENGRVLDVNDQILKMFGYERDEMIGKEIALMVAPESRALVAEAIRTNRESIYGHQLLRKDGSSFYAEARAKTVQVGSRTVRMTALRDITERIRAEERAQQTQKMEAIGALAGGIAHDFNNILAIIFGYTRLLEKDAIGNSTAQEHIAGLNKAANRAKDLVQQILAFSHHRQPKREVLRLDSVVKEAAKFLRASLPATIKIEMNLAGDAPPIFADPTQIYQVIINLATNALHAMEGMQGRLDICLESFLPDEKFIRLNPELKPIRYARLTMADTGHGMDAKTLERIFEPFFTTKPAGKGTGLGLAVVQGIVRSHEGIIQVESRAGHGATFHLYFPANMGNITSTTPPAVEPSDGRGRRILLVDDELALTTTYHRLLARLNYQVTSFNNPREAVASFRGNPSQFDLVITDLTMAEMTGLELARQLRAIRPDLPVILISGYATELNHEKLDAAGICELLEKPVSVDLLADALQRSLVKT
jgi:PAS domain S-box-containing protein